MHRTAPAQRFCLSILHQYQRWCAPLWPTPCRFIPSCSQYAVEAIEEHGVMMGLWLTGGRLLRCQPLARSGYDPVVPGGT